jgi:hypothetical protein
MRNCVFKNRILKSLVFSQTARFEIIKPNKH